jgi:hypothetical protein
MIGKPISIGSAGLDQPQRLQRLDGRTRKHRAIDIAAHERSSTISIHDRDRAAMAAFDDGTAQYLYQNRIGHDSP